MVRTMTISVNWVNVLFVFALATHCGPNAQERTYGAGSKTLTTAVASEVGSALVEASAPSTSAPPAASASEAAPSASASEPIPPSGTTPEELARIISKLDQKKLAGTPEAGLVISLARTACYGSCPIYAVSVRGDGTVNYRGIGFVRVKGDVTYHVSPATVIALANELEEGGYGNLSRRSTDCRMATDHPSANMSLTRNGSTLKSDHDHGDFCAPAKLAVFEDRIDTVLNTNVLVQCPDKRCAP
jgi:hypothetical protein